MAISRRILIVDDEQDLLDALTQLLELKSYSVFATTEGRKAIEAAKSEKFDVVLSHWFDRRENIAEMLQVIKAITRNQTGHHDGIAIAEYRVRR